MNIIAKSVLGLAYLVLAKRIRLQRRGTLRKPFSRMIREIPKKLPVFRLPVFAAAAECMESFNNEAQDGRRRRRRVAQYTVEDMQQHSLN